MVSFALAEDDPGAIAEQRDKAGALEVLARDVASIALEDGADDREAPRAPGSCRPSPAILRGRPEAPS
jgi:hypothetical protein